MTYVELTRWGGWSEGSKGGGKLAALLCRANYAIHTCMMHTSIFLHATAVPDSKLAVPTTAKGLRSISKSMRATPEWRLLLFATASAIAIDQIRLLDACFACLFKHLGRSPFETSILSGSAETVVLSKLFKLSLCIDNGVLGQLEFLLQTLHGYNRPNSAALEFPSEVDLQISQADRRKNARAFMQLPETNSSIRESFPSLSNQEIAEVVARDGAFNRLAQLCLIGIHVLHALVQDGLPNTHSSSRSTSTTTRRQLAFPSPCLEYIECVMRISTWKSSDKLQRAAKRSCISNYMNSFPDKTFFVQNVANNTSMHIKTHCVVAPDRAAHTKRRTSSTQMDFALYVRYRVLKHTIPSLCVTVS